MCHGKIAWANRNLLKRKQTTVTTVSLQTDGGYRDSAHLGLLVQATDAAERQGMTRKARVATPRSQGIYDPIRNSWVSPPQDANMIEGLAFAPRGVFSAYGRTL
jgi:hypothetical protein